MPRRARVKMLAASTALVTLLAACGGESAQTTTAPVAAPVPQSEGAAAATDPFLHRPVDRVAPGFTLIDSEGAPVSLSDFSGKWVVMDWVFTNCVTFCPLLTGDMGTLHTELGASVGDQVELVTITFDPTRDTPAAMRAYAAAVGGLRSGWTWLTGSQEETDAVAAAYGVSFSPSAPVGGADQFDHTNLMVVIGPDGRERHRYLGTGWAGDAAERLGEDLSAPSVAAPEAPTAPPAAAPEDGTLLASAIALPWEEWELTPGVDVQILYQFPNTGARAAYVDAMLADAAARQAPVNRSALSAMDVVAFPGDDGGFVGIGYTENLALLVEAETTGDGMSAFYAVDSEWCCSSPG